MKKLQQLQNWGEDMQLQQVLISLFLNAQEF
jgi:hypothetical protein